MLFIILGCLFGSLIGACIGAVKAFDLNTNQIKRDAAALEEYAEKLRH